MHVSDAIVGEPRAPPRASFDVARARSTTYRKNEFVNGTCARKKQSSRAMSFGN